MTDQALSLSAAAEAVAPTGFRLIYDGFAASVPVTGLAHAAEIASAAIAACGADADEHLSVALRPDRVELVVLTRGTWGVTSRDVELAELISAAVARAGAAPARPTGPQRPVQLLEIAIDALDIPAIRPFWKAVLCYEDGPGAGATGPIVDPAGQLPVMWFQQMDAPRPQRNRIHLDIDVAHEEAERRIRAALDAGGVLVSAERARSFWVLADREGNEICVCTWQDRD